MLSNEIQKRKRRTYKEMGRKTVAELKRELMDHGIKGTAHRSKGEVKLIYEAWRREVQGAEAPEGVRKENGYE